MITQGYNVGAPTPEVEEMDAQVIEGRPCPKCGSPLHYEGYCRQTDGYREYVALAVCDACGHEHAF
jgi:transposase